MGNEVKLTITDVNGKEKLVSELVVEILNCFHICLARSCGSFLQNLIKRKPLCFNLGMNFYKFLL